MKFFLIVLFSLCCLTASAQWYRLDFKKHIRPEAIELVANHSVARLPVIKPLASESLIKLLHRSDYSFHALEYTILSTAQHNMRFRIYNDASYNFSELAKLYIQQNRYAEAKWFLLQSNNISRGENDDKHTIDNLIDLATIKAGLGDYAQAQEDLAEAHELAGARGFKDDATAIGKKIIFLKQNRFTTPKVDVRYAETPQTTIKAE